MAKTPFEVEILTPEGEAFKGEVEMVSTRTTVGSIGILAKHQPILAMLNPTELRLYRSENDIVRYAQGEGYLQVSQSGSTLMLVDELIEAADLDRQEIEEKLRSAEAKLQSSAEGSEAAANAKRDINRFRVFLEIG